MNWITYLWRSSSRYYKSGRKIACSVLQLFAITNSKAFAATILLSTLASGVKMIHLHNVIIVLQKELYMEKIKDIVSFIKPFFKPYCTKMLRSNRKELYCLLLQQLCILKVYLPTSGIESLICSKSKSKCKMDISFYDFLS